MYFSAAVADGKPIQVYREANPENATAKLDPILADGWLQCLVEDGLVFTADKVRTVLDDLHTIRAIRKRFCVAWACP